MSDLFVDELDQARIDLAAALRQAYILGFSEGIINHFSVAAPGFPGHFLINPEGVHWSEIRAADILLVDEHGIVCNGKHRVEPTAFYIHSRIHRARPDSRCVFHVHSTYATAITLVDNGRLEMCCQSALRFYDRISYDRCYNGLVLNIEEGDRIVDALGSNDILFMANHGIIVCGEKISWAFDDLYYLERACKLQVLAQSTGRPLHMIPLDVLIGSASELVSERERALSDLHFSALKRSLTKTDKDWYAIDHADIV